jgi:hypothetical protein
MQPFKIIDNVISKDYQDYLEQLLLDSNDLPWFLIRNLNEIKSNQTNTHTSGLSIQSISDGKDHGMLALVFRSLAYNLAEKLDISINEIINARTFLQLPGGNLSETTTREYHVDYAKPHKVLLYYVNDSDGDTILLKQKYPFSHNKISGLTQGEILQTISPKKGRVVMFDGSHFHSSTIPSNQLRCVINIDIALASYKNN